MHDYEERKVVHLEASGAEKHQAPVGGAGATAAAPLGQPALLSTCLPHHSCSSSSELNLIRRSSCSSRYKLSPWKNRHMLDLQRSAAGGGGAGGAHVGGMPRHDTRHAVQPGTGRGRTGKCLISTREGKRTCGSCIGQALAAAAEGLLRAEGRQLAVEERHPLHAGMHANAVGAARPLPSCAPQLASISCPPQGSLWIPCLASGATPVRRLHAQGDREGPVSWQAREGCAQHQHTKCAKRGQRGRPQRFCCSGTERRACRTKGLVDCMPGAARQSRTCPPAPSLHARCPPLDETPAPPLTHDEPDVGAAEEETDEQHICRGAGAAAGGRSLWLRLAKRACRLTWQKLHCFLEPGSTRTLPVAAQRQAADVPMCLRPGLPGGS